MSLLDRLTAERAYGPEYDGVQVAGMGGILRELMERAARAPFDEGAGKAAKAAKAAKAPKPEILLPRRQITVNDPLRTMYPGIYSDPEIIADYVRRNTAPEDPWLKKLWGVTRDDLYEISKARGPGQESIIPFPKKPRGSEYAEQVTTRRNADRIVRAVEAASKAAPDFYKGMHSWYVMDPMYERARQVGGNAERLNTLTGMASPGSEVLTEINRGTFANMAAEQGLWDEFMEYGGMPKGRPGMERLKGHPYHSTSQALPMDYYLSTGELGLGTPKVPAYLQASRETGQHSYRYPVGDAHFSRAIGLPDVRTRQKDRGASITMPELATVAPWWKKQIADRLGVEPVPAQALTWGTFAGQTGVDSAIGAGKLELFTKRIVDTARRLGIPPDVLRDKVLRGEDYSDASGLMNMGAFA